MINTVLYEGHSSFKMSVTLEHCFPMLKGITLPSTEILHSRVDSLLNEEPEALYRAALRSPVYGTHAQRIIKIDLYVTYNYVSI